MPPSGLAPSWIAQPSLDPRPRRPLARWLAAGLVAAVGVAVANCSDADCAFVDDDVAGRTVNPEGIAYPTEDLGGTPRDGATPGQHFPNLTFQGYPRSERAQGLQTISLADYFDPDSRRQRLLLVMAAAMWCPYCRAETDELAAAAPALRDEGIEVLQILIDGPSQGEAPDRCSLEDWVDEHETTFSVVLDVRGRRLGDVVSLRSVPYNVILDTRTMEVLDAGSGLPSDLTGILQGWLAWIDDHPL